MTGIGRVGAGARVEGAGEESVDTSELSEEVDIGLIKRSRLRIEDFCLREFPGPSLLYAVGDHDSPANSVAVMQLG